MIKRIISGTQKISVGCQFFPIPSYIQKIQLRRRETTPITIYAAPNFEYQPKSYTLMAGTTKEDLKVLLEVSSAPQNSNRAANTVLNFDSTYIRYYKLIITETYNNKRNFVAFRYIKFGDGFTNNILPIDDERVFLFNSWERRQKLCTFGHLWVGNGNDNSLSKCQFAFNGSQIAVNAYYGKGFGTYSIYIDGNKRKTINLDKKSEKVELSYVSSLLPDGEHVIRFESSNSFNIDSMFFRKPTELDTYVENNDEYANNEVDDTVQPPSSTDEQEPDISSETPTIPDTKTEDTKPDDSKTEDTRPDDSKTEDTRPDDSKTEDTKPDDSKTDNTRPDDSKTEDTKPDDSKTDNTKPDDSKTDNDDINTSENNVNTSSNKEYDNGENNNNGNSNSVNKNKKSQTILIVGVVIGLIVAGVLSVIITIALLRKKREASSEAFMEE